MGSNLTGRAAASGRLTEAEFEAERRYVLGLWPTGSECDFDEAVAWQRSLPAAKDAPSRFRDAYARGRPLVFTRTQRFGPAQEALDESLRRNISLLNGVPVVNYGARRMREIVAATPIANQFRQGTPDGRLASETVFAAGYRAMLGGILGSVPHMRDMPIGECIRNWQYVDRLVGRYEEAGVSLHREYYGALMGMVMPLPDPGLPARRRAGSQAHVSGPEQQPASAPGRRCGAGPAPARARVPGALLL
jgi:methylaspartate mutase epsilon subunit